MVYLIVDETQNVCKIGYTESPHNRLKLLQTGNVNLLKLEKVIEGFVRDEVKIHTKFKHLRLRGEWFQYNQEIINYFNNPDPVIEVTANDKPENSCKPNKIITATFIDLIVPLSGNEIKILLYLISVSENNYVEVTKETKEALASKMGEFGNTSPQSITNTITSLAKKEIIRLVSKGSYLINSKYFGGLDASTTKLIEDIFKTKSLDEELIFTNTNSSNKPYEQLELELNDFNNLLNN